VRASEPAAVSSSVEEVAVVAAEAAQAEVTAAGVGEYR
jgi:hypothetical protein